MIKRFGVSLVALGLAVAAPRLRAQDTTGLRRTVERGTMPLPAGMMTPNDVRALGPRFVGVRVIPDSVSLRVGDTLAFDSIRLVAVDSAGRILGRLPIFDTHMNGSSARLLLFRGLAAVRSGLTLVLFPVPRPFWFQADSTRPVTQLRVSVHE
jgi:hypothetical protein